VNTETKTAAVAAWLGFALAALFLYPLAVALDSDVFYMQWQPGDTIEVVAALVLLWVVFAVLILALWRRAGRAATLGLAAVAALPLASFVAGLLRQLPFEDALVAFGNSPLRFAIPIAAGAALPFIFLRWPDAFGRWLRRGLVAISFVAVVVVSSFVRAASYAAPSVRVQGDTRSAAPRTDCSSVVAFLFDELSFTYLYDERGDVRAEYPAFRRLSAMSTNYLAAQGPADETLVALPGYLAGRHVERVSVEELDLVEVGEEGELAPLALGEPAGLFATARRLGYRTEMAGYYLPYCRLLADLVDECRSFSFYNASGVHDGFSPINPMLTALIMWPRQFPFGIVKNIPFARLQRGLVEQLSEFARRPLMGAQPVFRFIHFSVPHLPFVFDQSGYNPGFNPLRTSPDDGYRRQLRYVDGLLAQLVATMEHGGTFDGATLVVLADHGFRFGGFEQDPLHIPFIVKKPGQRARTDVAERQRGELLLPEIVRSACKS
jgi:Sulfatase